MESNYDIIFRRFSFYTVKVSSTLHANTHGRGTPPNTFSKRSGIETHTEEERPLKSGKCHQLSSSPHKAALHSTTSHIKILPHVFNMRFQVDPKPDARRRTISLPAPAFSICSQSPERHTRHTELRRRACPRGCQARPCTRSLRTSRR